MAGDHHAGHEGLTDEDIELMFRTEPEQINDLPDQEPLVLDDNNPPF
jgi:hypothetical protein